MASAHRPTDQHRRQPFGHNFGIVYQFEVSRALRKPSFWVSILLMPAMFAVIFWISYLSGQSAQHTSQDLTSQQLSVAITDDSGLINPQLASVMHASITTDRNQAIKQVKGGQLEAYFYYPADLTKQRIEIYAQDAGLFESDKYAGLATTLLKQSVKGNTSPAVAAVLSDQINTTSTYYKDGAEYNQLGEMIIPGCFLILLVLIVCIFGSQMLTATIEEKENRISEMLLTTVKPRTLITGKIFAFMTLILIQVITIIALIIGGYFLLAKVIDLPNIDLSIIAFNPARIAIAAALFVVSALMFSGIMVTIGAATPTAKEANQFIGIPILLLFAPLYVTGMIISTPDAPAIQAITYFPLTAPMPALIQNAMGTLSISNAVICIALMTVTTAIIFIIASHLFQTGAVEYHKRLRLLPRQRIKQTPTK